MTSRSQSHLWLLFTESAVDEAEVDQLDEKTKLFNFWTHQLHIFFVRKYFPAAQKMATLRRLVEEALEQKRADEERKRLQLEADEQQQLQLQEQQQQQQMLQNARDDSTVNVAATGGADDADAGGSERTETTPSEVAVHG